MLVYFIYLVIILAVLASIAAIHPGIATGAYLVGIYIFLVNVNTGKSTGQNYVAGAPAVPPMPSFVLTILSIIFTLAVGFLLFLNWKNSKQFKSLEFQQYWIKMFSMNIIGLGTIVIMLVAVLILSFVGSAVYSFALG